MDEFLRLFLQATKTQQAVKCSKYTLRFVRPGFNTTSTVPSKQINYPQICAMHNTIRKRWSEKVNTKERERLRCEL